MNKIYIFIFFIFFIYNSNLMCAQKNDKFNCYFQNRVSYYFDKIIKISDFNNDFNTLTSTSIGWDASIKLDFQNKIMTEVGYGNRYISYNLAKKFPFNSLFEDSVALALNNKAPISRREYLFISCGFPFVKNISKSKFKLEITPTIQFTKFLNYRNDSTSIYASYLGYPYTSRVNFLYGKVNYNINGLKEKHFNTLPFLPTFRLSLALLYYLVKSEKVLRVEIDFSNSIIMNRPESDVSFNFYNTDGSLLKKLTLESYARSISLSFGISF